MKPSCFPRFVLSLTVAILLFLQGSVSLAQGPKKFASEGVTELGGSVSFQLSTPVSNGNTGESTSLFTFAPFIGIFIDDGFELGLNPFSITSLSFSGGSITQVMILAAPSYNFKISGSANQYYPFVEALLGYTSQSSGSTRSGFAWGGRAGFKIPIAEQGLLNIGVQYLQITMNPAGATNRYGTNQLTVSAGFTIWR